MFVKKENGKKSMINLSKISIIIPVYNVEKYIEKCLKSIQSQSYSNFEALIIDDGSPDQSITLAKALVKDDPRFIFLEKENGGQSSARNMGLDNTSGEYIAFIDPDDYVEANYLLELFQCLNENLSDIACCGINYVDIHGNSLKTTFSDSKAFYENDDFLVTQSDVTNFMCDKLFKSHIFRKTRFDTSLRSNEDVHLIFQIIFGKKISSTHQALYNYLQRPSSTSKAVHPTYLQDRITIRDAQLKFIQEHNLESQYSDYITYTYMKTFIFCCATTFALCSQQYSVDIQLLKENIDPNIFTFKKIFSLIKSRPKIGLSLLIFKVSPSFFKKVVKFYLRNTIV